MPEATDVKLCQKLRTAIETKLDYLRADIRLRNNRLLQSGVTRLSLRTQMSEIQGMLAAFAIVSGNDFAPHTFRKSTQDMGLLLGIDLLKLERMI